MAAETSRVVVTTREPSGLDGKSSLHVDVRRLEQDTVDVFGGITS